MFNVSISLLLLSTCFLLELTDREGQNLIMWSTVLMQRNAPKIFMS